jgi:YD repeat-containing protein
MGKVTKREGPHGNRWDVSYGGEYISKIKGPEGEEVSYWYGGGGKLEGVTDADGDTVRYTYEGERLKRIVKGDGSYIELTYGYDGEGGRSW